MAEVYMLGTAIGQNLIPALFFSDRNIACQKN